MQPLTSIQNSIASHVRTFLVHRHVVFSEKVGPLGGAYAKEQPEVYIAFEAANGLKIFIYEDGQSEVMKDGKDILNLEVESYPLQELETIFFKKLTELFGKYPSS